MNAVIEDNRFLVSYQNRRHCREHRIVVDESKVEELRQFHARHGNVFSAIPLSIASDEKFC